MIYLRITIIFLLGNIEHIRNLGSNQTGKVETFTCGGLNVLLIWDRNGVFLSDFHSLNIEGFPDPNTSAVFLEFRFMWSLNNLIKRFYQVNLPNSFLLQYDIQYIKFNIPAESISNIKTILNCQRNSNYCYQSKNRSNDIHFEIDYRCY